MSRRPTSDTERLIRFAIDVGGRLSHALGERIPDDAKSHLLNAQRELITALVIMYEQQAGMRRRAMRDGNGARGGRRKAAQSRRARTTRIRVD